jgi:pyrroline-5-carboxylate reductase
VTQQSICFIGAGNMASSLIGGMIANQVPALSITACDINEDQLNSLKERYGINVSTDNLSSVQAADVVILAVKPQVMSLVCEPLAILSSEESRLFISIAAGVTGASINRWMGGNRAVVRCMPNTPALLQLGATGLYANENVGTEQRSTAEAILQAVGITLWVDEEKDLDAVTAVSGSGPAYFFYFIECLEAAGVKMGLSAETSAKLARQTALGAASMALNSDVVTLREQVTSKKGTTEQAILSFQNNNLKHLVEIATAAAQRRSQELSSELDVNSD